MLADIRHLDCVRLELFHRHYSATDRMGAGHDECVRVAAPSQELLLFDVDLEVRYRIDLTNEGSLFRIGGREEILIGLRPFGICARNAVINS